MIIEPVKVTLKPKQKLILIPLGDVQGEEQLDRLDRLIAYCVQQEKRGHVVRLFLTGDYFETFSPSERVKKAGANFHETTLESIHNYVKAQADDFVRRLSPMKGKVLTVLQGHHWDHIKVGGTIMSSDQYIAEKLDAKYVGDGVVLLEISVNGLPFYVFAMHGYGSGRQPGGRLNKRLQMREIYLTANWYVMGHDNSKVADTKEPLVKTLSGDLGYLKQYFTGVGCFQEAYHIGKLETGYAERLGLPPASIGVFRGTVRIDERGGRKRLDYHVSM